MQCTAIRASNSRLRSRHEYIYPFFLIVLSLVLFDFLPAAQASPYESCQSGRDDVPMQYGGGGYFNWRICCSGENCRLDSCDDFPVLGEPACPEPQSDYFPPPWGGGGGGAGRLSVIGGVFGTLIGTVETGGPTPVDDEP